MNFDQFKEYLFSKDLPEDKIKSAIDLLEEFDEFVTKRQNSIENASYDDLHDFSAFLIENNKNSYDNFIYLLRFGYFMKSDPLIIATMELVDGGEIMVNFSNRMKDEFGEGLRNEVFNQIEFPLGLHPKKKADVTKEVMERFLQRIDRTKCATFLAEGLRDKYTESYKKPREEFLKMNDIDKFLEYKHKNLIETLETHMKDGTLWFTQEIDEEVLDYVRKNRMTEAGIREGNKVILTKVPYMTKKYLQETDVQKKRYYYCHCPWVREGLKEEDQPVDPAFCNCSGGYYKNYWEAVLGQPVKVDLLESVIQGNQVCKFALHLPAGIVED
ncbi:MAG: hypothetical protein ACXACU_07675 [Candidatus Hodarchaeales archaeon]|jgi:hypothetical protein